LRNSGLRAVVLCGTGGTKVEPLLAGFIESDKYEISPFSKKIILGYLKRRTLR
jgi:hypothetical protein